MGHSKNKIKRGKGGIVNFLHEGDRSFLEQPNVACVRNMG